MEKKVVSGMLLMLTLTSMLFFTFSVQPVKAQGETIYVRADGTVDPSTASILRDGDVYTFTDNILVSIVVERSNIIVDGNGYTLQGSGSGNGFQLDGVNNVTIQNVTIQSFATAIDINNSSYNVISRNILTDNGGFMGAVILESPYSNYNNTFLGNTFSNNSGSCLSLHGFYDVVSENFITNNSAHGINLQSGHHTVSENILTNNTGAGIAIYSHRNNVFGNNITKHTSKWLGQGIGIYLGFGASDNTISRNTIADNKVGILMEDSSDNTIVQNNLINNTNQTSLWETINTWDDGSEGNYWSDYNGTDSDGDGIGDTLYIIDENNQDNYPLMAPICRFDAGKWAQTQYFVDCVSNSTVSGFYFDPTEGAFLRFNVEGESGTSGFCRVTIPKELLHTEGDWIVLVDGASVTPTVNEDASNTYLYFTYNHSTKTIEIIGTSVIPEFLSWALILFILTALAVAVAIYITTTPKTDAATMHNQQIKTKLRAN